MLIGECVAAGRASARGVTVIGGSIVFANGDAVDLPGKFLECLRYPNPRSVRLESFFYKDPRDDTALTLDEFTFVVAIDFGRPGVAYSENDVVHFETPSVSFHLTNKRLARAKFTRPDGELRSVEPVLDACPVDELEWVASP